MGEQAGECLYKCVIEHHFEGGTVWQKGWPQGGNRVATGWQQGQATRAGPRNRRYTDSRQEQAALVVLSLWHC